MIKKIVLFLAIVGGIMDGLLAQSSASLSDEVSILKLDQPLVSSSQLGGVTVDRLGFVYVSNFREAVWQISPAGEVKLLTDGLYGASGNTIDAKGNLFQANFLSHSLVKIDRFGEVSTYMEKGFNGPVGLVFDQAQNLYVCNFNENNILKISPDKQMSVFASGALFNGPNGITIDAAGNLYVVNFNNNDVVQIDSSGKATVFATIAGVDGNAHIVAYNDNFYVTKIKSNRVYQLNKAGKVKLLGGTGQSVITEGPALEASFAAPNGIGVDAQTGILYVNNVKGQWGSRQASTIEISKIKLLTLSQLLSHHLDKNEMEAAKKSFQEYRNDPFHAAEDVAAALVGLGWQYMTRRNVPASLLLFTLNSETYPDRWQSFFNLGEVYKIIGQAAQAKTFYEKALEKSPGNKRILERLKQVSK